jgi:hypothetical protein
MQEKEDLIKSTISSLKSYKLWRPLTWLLTIAIPVRTVIPTAESLVEEENPFNFYDGYQNLQHSTTWKPNVLRVTSTQTWKITSMWKFSFYEHVSFPHWPMNEPKFYPQVQIMHNCIVFSMWAKPINNMDNISFYFLNNIIFFL